MAGKGTEQIPGLHRKKQHIQQAGACQRGGHGGAGGHAQSFRPGADGLPVDGRHGAPQRPAHKAVQPGPHRQAVHEHHQREGVRPRQKAGGPAGQVPGEQGKPDIGLAE